MSDNLARNMEEQSPDVYEAQFQTLKEEQYSYDTHFQPEMSEAIETQKGLTRVEKLMVFVIGAIIFSLILFNIYTDFQLTNTNRNVENTLQEIERIEFENENLKQHVHELSRYDRIQEIAEKYNLEFYEQNIKNISSTE